MLQAEGQPNLASQSDLVDGVVAEVPLSASTTLSPQVFVNLSGVWAGQSTPFSKGAESTLWSDCALVFTPQFKIQGNGQSVWKGDIITFRLVGSVDPLKRTFEIYKTHNGKYTNTIVYQGKLIAEQRRLEGEYRAGSLTLTRQADLPSTATVSAVPTQLAFSAPQTSAVMTTQLFKSNSMISSNNKETKTSPSLSPDAGQFCISSQTIALSTTTTVPLTLPSESLPCGGCGMADCGGCLAEKLSGEWSGQYYCKKTQQITIWRHTLLIFSVSEGQGRVSGKGESLWRTETIPFLVQGTFDAPTMIADLTKVHTGKYTNSLRYVLRIDIKQMTMNADYPDGTMILAHMHPLQRTTLTSTLASTSTTMAGSSMSGSLQSQMSSVQVMLPGGSPGFIKIPSQSPQLYQQHSSLSLPPGSPHLNMSNSAPSFPVNSPSEGQVGRANSFDPIVHVPNADTKKSQLVDSKAENNVNGYSVMVNGNGDHKPSAGYVKEQPALANEPDPSEQIEGEGQPQPQSQSQSSLQHQGNAPQSFYFVPGHQQQQQQQQNSLSLPPPASIQRTPSLQIEGMPRSAPLSQQQQHQSVQMQQQNPQHGQGQQGQSPPSLQQNEIYGAYREYDPDLVQKMASGAPGANNNAGNNNNNAPLQAQNNQQQIQVQQLQIQQIQQQPQSQVLQGYPPQFQITNNGAGSSSSPSSAHSGNLYVNTQFLSAQAQQVLLGSNRLPPQHPQMQQGEGMPLPSSVPSARHSSLYVAVPSSDNRSQHQSQQGEGSGYQHAQNRQQQLMPASGRSSLGDQEFKVLSPTVAARLQMQQMQQQKEGQNQSPQAPSPMHAATVGQMLLSAQASPSHRPPSSLQLQREGSRGATNTASGPSSANPSPRNVNPSVNAMQIPAQVQLVHGQIVQVQGSVLIQAGGAGQSPVQLNNNQLVQQQPQYQGEGQPEGGQQQQGEGMPQQVNANANNSVQQQGSPQQSFGEKREKYTLFLGGMLASGQSLTAKQLDALGKFRQQHAVSDDDHSQVLALLGLTEDTFGIMVSSARAEEAKAAEENDMCKICFDNPMNCIILPCAHFVICHSCSKKLDKCPVCRGPIKEAKVVYKS